ncbi:Rne/Rng family ribonuclease [Phytoactinopolyspora alkaliphila]|uniref:Ribonuclease E n=1 Tax=Phytoactinopolyspora alkaliphila TaxID=1783498 RepID=A0A6N9YNA5_9ACTN|nr:Rne/Rng family ribonuclease [Phytoactinopolyspora alkaliphila]NED96328.1 Rne/Rng family ribonuclease [Phytoactinopolyspora alkaliphila]
MQDENTGLAENENSVEQTEPARRRTPRKRTASRVAGPPEEGAATEPAPSTAAADLSSPDATDPGTPETPSQKKKAAAKKAPAKKAAAKKAPAKKAAAKKAAARKAEAVEAVAAETIAAETIAADTAETEPPATEAEQPAPRASRSRKRAARGTSTASSDQAATTAQVVAAAQAADEPNEREGSAAASTVLFQPPAFDATPLFEPPTPAQAAAARAAVVAGEELAEEDDASEAAEPASGDDDDESGNRRRRRRRGGRGRRKKGDGPSDDTDQESDDPPGDAQKSAAARDTGSGEDAADDADATAEAGDDGEGDGEGQDGSRRRRRRRRRKSEGDEDNRSDDPPHTVVKVRETKDSDDEVSLVKGSTRLEAKKQRRREGREAGRRRPPILTESEFLARREAVDRVMAVRQDGDLTQIAVLEDDILVEHYVSQASQQSMIGNVYLGRVQNVLPAMEAAFVDIGRGRNAVVYAGEIDWAGLGHTDGPKRIEDVLKSGQSILVQVTKDPIGHKGARLTGQVSLPGRYVVYVPRGSMSGISRKLPENERNRLKKILKKVVPEDAGVIVRTAAEGASEEELTNDVERLQAEWEAIQKKTSGNAPALLHGEPDLAIKVVRDLFNEDFTKLVVSGERAWSTIDEYVSGVASSLRDRVQKWTGNNDVFAALRVDEQIAKALDRKVWLPSGGSLVIDRTEAMTVIDVNTGKFTGSGGNLEETVTKNNLEAAEEIVRQLRLRDIGGIIVIDFIDMVLESNRDLVLRRLVECLGRDRTKHQVAEVTSLGLVQMTRKRIGTGLLEAFSEPCAHCKGRGVQVHNHVGVEGSKSNGDDSSGRSERRGRRRRGEQQQTEKPEPAAVPKLEALASPGEASPADLIPVSAGTPDANGVSASPVSAEADTRGVAVETNGSPAEPVATPAEPVATPAEPADVPESPTGDDDAPKPARRGRRRAQRPAGSPDEHADATA